MNAKIQGLVILLLSIFLFSSCTDDPSADFTPSATSVEVGEVVTFEDKSSNGDKYFWDFGNGEQETFSTASSPTHRYDSPGTYTVTQVVKNDAGTSEKSQTIEVGDDPSADFTPSATSVEVGEVVTFEDKSSNGDKYLWDFGDGEQETFSTATSPTHRYNSQGTYTVTQVVKNDAGTSEQSQTIEVGSAEVEEQRLQIMNGVWDLDEFEETNYINNSQDSQTRITFQSTTVEFISSNDYLRNDDDGNESTGSWELLKKDRIEWQSEVYVINTLEEDEMVLRRVEKSTFGGQNERDVYEYRFSR